MKYLGDIETMTAPGCDSCDEAFDLAYPGEIKVAMSEPYQVGSEMHPTDVPARLMFLCTKCLLEGLRE